MKTKLSEINSTLSSDLSLLVCSSSFEMRWYQIAKNISADKLRHIAILQKSMESNVWDCGIKEIEKVHGKKYEIIITEGLAPVELWKKLCNELIPLIKNQELTTLIDITTLTHEVVIFIVSLINANELSSKVILAYAGASAYFVSENKSDWWLSRGVKEIRSILGFPGLIRPSKKPHLIILVGFETERAKELIVQYEPSSISLGIGVEPYNQEFLEKNNWFKEQLQIFISSIGNSVKHVSEFEFSCSDYESAKKTILLEASKFEDYNITIAPMNTKVSTVAAASAALENETLKLCYVEPMEYNKEFYSTPGDTLTLIKI
jgi:hypothetical protein